MGIPYLFGILVKKNKNIVTNDIPICNRMFIDFNAIIHTVSATVINTNPNYTNEDIFTEIIKYVNMIVCISKPTDLLYIAVDGVAPCAKIQQQRKRRYISAYRNESINNFKQKNNMSISNWDSNCITPGTVFMIELDIYLNKYFNDNKYNFKTIISGHTESSEGEHKIINYIKNNNNINENELNCSTYTDVILGLDCDLVMLSLGCENSNIYLMRESVEFGKYVNIESTILFKFLDINVLRKDVANHLYENNDNDNNNKKSYMYDYIFISFLLGNDFIPSMSFLKLKNNALDIICDVYKKIYNQLNEYLVIKSNSIFSINQKFLIKIFEQFSNMEDLQMKNAVNEYDTITFNQYKKFPTKLERYIYEFENIPLINKYPNNINPNNNSNWRSNYYHYLFGSMSTVIMKESALKYIEGLLWNTNYYFNNSIDKSWFYQYNYSPCASDLYKYSCTMDNVNFIKLEKKLSINDNNIIIDSIMQMLMVLPPQSKTLLPYKFQCLYTDINLGCTHLFPSKFILSTFLKTQTWESSPILPIIDIKQLKINILKI